MAEPRSGPGSLGLSSDQLRNANIIIGVGLKMGMGWRDIKIALMTAIQESSLINNPGGHADSAGLFQQRPSMGWGTYDQVTDPQYSARKFYSTLQGVTDREDMPLWQAAATVQRPAEEYETYYRHHFGTASALLKSYRGDNPGANPSGVPTTTTTEADPTLSLQKLFSQTGAKRGTPTTPGIAAAKPPGMEASIEPLVLPQFNTRQQFNQAMEKMGALPRGPKGVNQIRRQIAKYAKQFIGDPYVYGGETPGAFDCSGFTQYVYAHFGINLPRISYQQGQAGYAAFNGRRNDLSKLQVGDLVFWDNSSRNNGADHVAIYLGNGLIIEAPRPGRSVGISELYDTDSAWGVHLNL